jgi:hypothetical protein
VILPAAAAMISSKIRFPADYSVSFPFMILLISMSMQSRIVKYVFLFAVILMTGAIGDPAGVPLPVVKTTICVTASTNHVIERRRCF